MSVLIGGGRRLAELSDKLAELSEKIEKQSEGLHRRLEEVRAEVLKDAKADSLLGERTYDLFHSDSELIRSFSGKVFNRDKPCTNPAFVELMKHATNDQIEDVVWQKILAEVLVEAAAVPGAEQVFERQAYIKDYLAQLARTFRAKYGAGWVDLNDALFLYWLVRRARPRRILQCGAFNGLSSAFMMLALARNGPEGKLSIIDQPAVFDSHDPQWRIEGKAYGAVVPEGKSSAWMVPDHYHDRLELSTGDVGSLLQKAIDGLDGIDLFYYAADHTYRDMMSAFESAKRKLRAGGVLVAVDVGWNVSLWDFTQRHGAPSYTFKSAIGVGFF
jgi:predicted O-methyltransferase YrrM